MPDHFHILIGQRPNVALSDVVRDIKAGSSGFINDCLWSRLDAAPTELMAIFFIADL
jgi:REP element-mobilizing transposase RayT